MRKLTLELDHLVVAAPTLERGVAWVEERFGATPARGGKHEGIGTHNRLLGLGDCYLEVIARDPDGDVRRPRIFGLDDACWDDPDAEPRLVTFLLRTDDLGAALALPGAAGVARDMRRDALAWRIGVPADDALPFDGAYPLFIQWPDFRGPARTMPDSGLRLASLTVTHPRADEIAEALRDVLRDARIRFEPGASMLSAALKPAAS